VRRPLIVGNCKMNGTNVSARHVLAGIAEGVGELSRFESRVVRTRRGCDTPGAVAEAGGTVSRRPHTGSRNPHAMSEWAMSTATTNSSNA
jgi:hypothetical protein